MSALDYTPTPRAMEIYEWFFDYTMKNGFQPTYREAMSKFGIISPDGLTFHMQRWAKAGYIKKEFYKNRALKLLKIPDGRKFEGFVPK